MPCPKLDKAATFGAGHLVKQTGADPANGKAPLQFNLTAEVGDGLGGGHLLNQFRGHLHCGEIFF
jgi:hypothetical protein